MFGNRQEEALGLDGWQGFSTGGADAPCAQFTGERREVRGVGAAALVRAQRGVCASDWTRTPRAKIHSSASRTQVER
jgi:hypothetical protein